MDGGAAFPLHVRPQVEVGEIRVLSPSDGRVEIEAGQYDVLLRNSTSSPVALPAGEGHSTSRSLFTSSESSGEDDISRWKDKLYTTVQRRLPQGRPVPPAVAALDASPQNLPHHRTFHFPNLADGGQTSKTLPSTLIFADARVAAYVDDRDLHQAHGEEDASVSGIVRTFSQRLLPLEEKLFGRASDVDGNRRLLLFFSGELNASGLAVGFFNPLDLMRFDDTNPGSNEAEVLYLGLPQQNDLNFNHLSLKATACHEFQHLAHFGNKTLPYLGDDHPPFETIAVNEGMSHLAEDLCGYNTMGGNVAFVSAFLQNASGASLDGLDSLGRDDTIERRGAMYLFLRKLYEQQSYQEEWLKSIIHSHESGLENIVQKSNTTIDQAVSDFQWTVILAGQDGPGKHKFAAPQINPATGDYMGIDLTQGEVTLGDGTTRVQLRGMRETQGWPEALPARGFASMRLYGPLELEVPYGIQVQVYRRS
ncbi:hypothetical protein [Deinococcus aestuarii]|uniref:hypothetical protein n=1 Tax=Deinococcus aestuarii TaxID=2774531 RepID=UPI001C0DAA6B|nr:hypothetical protein [Deinococcus aestuarii]